MAALEAKTLNPQSTASVPKADQSKFPSDYRTDPDEQADAFNQVEAAVKAGQNDKAKSLLATVNSIKKEGHGKFKRD